MNELAVDRVVADRQRLPLAAEDDLLVGDEARQPDRVDRLVDVGAGRGEQLGGPRGGARGLVELAVVVELDDLDLGHELGDPLADLHHQDGADREVRSDECAPALSPVPVIGGALAQLLEVEAGRPDDDADAGVQALVGVRQRLVGDREVDDDVGVVERRRRARRRARDRPCRCSSRPSAASTASQTVAPIRPAAPATATRIGSAMRRQHTMNRVRNRARRRAGAAVAAALIAACLAPTSALASPPGSIPRSAAPVRSSPTSRAAKTARRRSRSPRRRDPRDRVRRPR